ncbi:hypothetical protein [Streptosporangium roseum]|uniref:Uncharacterized protein n=1 Tax=Streptosporangium roseum (strain ATCC 12428 / DSM 43021 / JCM 3005 / KCTC 9067 / NCIMB 10171 / NRRL 2505 / NI 9100) TaxID=479432 RepID=D2BBP1_STRRD|nr:hypothetical protein [Streptosporangium roseum]ACZ86110.1 hypothetical protein Sros_3165 [Streptosporangium roseum DSM 43021]
MRRGAGNGRRPPGGPFPRRATRLGKAVFFELLARPQGGVAFLYV